MPIALGDGSKINAEVTGSSTVHWNIDSRITTVELSNVLAYRSLSMDLLSIPALTAKGISVLFTEKKAFIIDMEDDNCIIGVANRDSNDLYFIGTHEEHDCQRKIDSSDAIQVNACIAVTAHEEFDKHSSRDDDHTSVHHENSDEDLYIKSRDTEFNVNCNESVGDSEEEIQSYIGKIDLKTVLPTKLYISTQNEDHHVKSSMNEQVWHKHLSHFGSLNQIKEMLKSGKLPFISEGVFSCDPCATGKFRRKYKGSITKETIPGTLHADLIGPISPHCRSGNIYLLTIVDEHSRFIEVEPLTSKSDTSRALLQIIVWFERQTGALVRVLHADGGSEFFPEQSELRKKGVIINKTSPYTRASNGLVERCLGTLLSALRSVLNESKLPLSYWSDALQFV